MTVEAAMRARMVDFMMRSREEGRDEERGSGQGVVLI